MEFPKLHRQTEAQLKKTGGRAERTQKDVDRGYDRLGKIEKTADNKQRDYEKYQDLIGEDPEAAKALWEKKKLGVTWERWDKKDETIKKLRTKLNVLFDSKEQLESDLPEIKDFSPMQDQANHPVTQKEFYLAEGKWKIQNSKFKLFQDSLTPPPRRIRPRVDEDSRYRETPYDEIPLQFCVANPQWIQFTYL